MFSEKINELSQSTTCTCNACTHIEKLRLKVVVHSGEALFHRVFNFVELAGVDVIIVHRLLKNSVAADQYLLLTEAARHDLEFSEPIKLNERLRKLTRTSATINTLIFLPDAETNSGISPRRALHSAAVSAARGNYFANCGLRLLRHGQTSFTMWNRARRSVGESDSPH